MPRRDTYPGPFGRELCSAAGVRLTWTAVGQLGLDSRCASLRLPGLAADAFTAQAATRGFDPMLDTRRRPVPAANDILRLRGLVGTTS